MTTLAEDFRAFLLAQAPIVAIVDQRVHHNVVPEDSFGPRICYFRRQTLVERAMNETSAEPTMVAFDVECGAESLAAADPLADLVRATLDNYRGAFGEGTVQGIFVEDHDEDYALKTNDSDEFLHVATFQVEIFP